MPFSKRAPAMVLVEFRKGPTDVTPGADAGEALKIEAQVRKYISMLKPEKARKTRWRVTRNLKELVVTFDFLGKATSYCLGVNLLSPPQSIINRTGGGTRSRRICIRSTLTRANGIRGPYTWAHVTCRPQQPELKNRMQHKLCLFKWRWITTKQFKNLTRFPIY